MRLFLMVCTAALATSIGAAHATIVDVLSGDTIQIETKVVRLANVEAPRAEDTCEREKTMALIARSELQKLIVPGEMEIRPTGQVDERQHVMAFVLINGEDVGEKLIKKGWVWRRGEEKVVYFSGGSATPVCGRSRDQGSGLKAYRMRTPSPIPPAAGSGGRGR